MIQKDTRLALFKFSFKTTGGREGLSKCRLEEQCDYANVRDLFAEVNATAGVCVCVRLSVCMGVAGGAGGEGGNDFVLLTK